MKKLVIVMILFLLVGCRNEKTPEPIKDTVSTINESKETTVNFQVKNLFQQAEMKLIMELDKKCISASELSSATGEFCLDDNDNLYAKDIRLEGYICNGYKTDLKCVGEGND